MESCGFDFLILLFFELEFLFIEFSLCLNDSLPFHIYMILLMFDVLLPYIFDSSLSEDISLLKSIWLSNQGI